MAVVWRHIQTLVGTCPVWQSARAFLPISMFQVQFIFVLKMPFLLVGCKNSSAHSLPCSPRHRLVSILVTVFSLNILVMWWVISVKAICSILILKPTRSTNSQIYFWNKTVHVLNSSSVHHQEFFTIHTAVVLQAGSGWNWSSILILLASWQQNLYDINHCCVQWKTPDDGQWNCPKHVEFYSKNKFEN